VEPGSKPEPEPEPDRELGGHTLALAVLASLLGAGFSPLAGLTGVPTPPPSPLQAGLGHLLDTTRHRVATQTRAVSSTWVASAAAIAPSVTEAAAQTDDDVAGYQVRFQCSDDTPCRNRNTASRVMVALLII
jgi:hypothetical protein